MGRQLALESCQYPLGPELLRHHICLDSILPQFPCRGGTDSSHLGKTQRAGILPGSEQTIEEVLHPIGAGENQPVVILHMGDSFVQCLIVILRGLELDGRSLNHPCPQSLQGCCQLGSLAPGAGHQHSLAEQGTIFQVIEPLEAFAELHHFAHNKDGWRLQPGLCHIFSRPAHGGFQHPLFCLGAPADYCRGGIRRTPMLHQFLGDMGQIGHPHEEHQRIHPRGELVPAHI